jgi:hypothetical protein
MEQKCRYLFGNKEGGNNKGGVMQCAQSVAAGLCTFTST